MTIDNAAELHRTRAARFNAKDLDGMLALAEADSVFVPQPGVVVQGDGVRAAEQQFLSMGLPITLTVRRAIVSGDIALLISDWSLKGKGAPMDPRWTCLAAPATSLVADPKGGSTSSTTHSARSSGRQAHGF